MNNALAWAKQHWGLLLGGFVGLIILYYLYEELASASASSSSSSTDLSGGANQLQALSTAADLTNAQVNASVESSELGAEVSNNQTAAALQASLANTAATTAVQQQTVSAEEAVALGAQQAGVQTTQIQTEGQVQQTAIQTKGAVEVQQLQSNQAVQQTAIEGSTIENVATTEGATQVAVAKTQASVALAQISDVNSQVQNIMTYSKHASQDLTAIAPIIAEETGQGSSAPGIATANANKAVGTAQATSSTVTKGISSIFSGLFG